MIDLADLSSAIQLACGLNLAAGVILQRQRALLSPHEEYVAWVRSVVKERVSNTELRAKLDHQLAVADDAIFSSRFTNLRAIRRLPALCILAGLSSLFLLVLPAFQKPTELSTAAAILTLLAIFAPLPLALFDVENRYRRRLRSIEHAKDELQNVVEEALQNEA